MSCQVRSLFARQRLLTAVFVGAALLLTAAGASALSFPTDVYLLPTSDSPDIFLNGEEWIRLHPIGPLDPGPTDYDATVTAGTAQTVSGLLVVPLTFNITWNGTRDEGTLFTPTDDQLLFTIIDSRQGIGRALATTVDIPNSGIQRGSFGGDLLGGEMIVQDAPLGGGFVDDGFGTGNFVGVYLDAVTTPQTVTVNWVLSGSLPLPASSNEIWLANAIFARVPEPTAGLLLAGGLLALALRRRSRG